MTVGAARSGRMGPDEAPSVIPPVFRGKAGEPPGIIAVARVDRRTKNISKRLNPGEIAVIDHSDLDRVSAEELIKARRSRRSSTPR